MTIAELETDIKKYKSHRDQNLASQSIRLSTMPQTSALIKQFHECPTVVGVQSSGKILFRQNPVVRVPVFGLETSIEYQRPGIGTSKSIVGQ